MAWLTCKLPQKFKLLLNLFKDCELLSPFVANLQKVSYLKLHIHEHTFVKSCCFLEALNVHSSKAETVQLRVQSSVFFCDGHKFPRLKIILIRTLSALNSDYCRILVDFSGLVTILSCFDLMIFLVRS